MGFVKFMLVVLFLAACISAESEESLSEELLLKPLSNGDLLAQFRFTVVAPGAGTTDHGHYHLFPRGIGELLRVHSLREFSVSLSRGVWRDKNWGFSPHSHPTGANVKAWFNKDVSNVDQSWTRLVNGLSGQLCASLNFLDSTVSVSPRFTYAPAGVLPDEQSNENNSTDSDDESYFRVGSLPGENVCTENLTPWKKLLPCESKRGLATLLNAASVHKSKYHSLGLSVRQVCPGGKLTCAHPVLELTQFVTLVLNPNIMPENEGGKGSWDPQPVSWSIRSIFGIGLNSDCPMAQISKIYLDDSAGSGEFSVTPPGDRHKSRTSITVFDLKDMVDQGHGNIIVNYKKPAVFGIVNPPALHATRYLVGYGQEKGGIVTKISNNLPSNLRVVYLDVVPWYLRLYFHSVKISSIPKAAASGGSKKTDDPRSRLLRPLKVEFSPGRDRESPYVLEMVVELPANSVTEISIDFEKSLLKWLEYPPDANHGFYVGSAVVSAILPKRDNFTDVPRQHGTYWETFNAVPSSSSSQSGSLLQIYTESLLVSLPTPDFSMPYNVICLACTVVALAFGPLHNITTKNLTIEEGEMEKGFLGKLIAKVKGLFGRREQAETATEEPEEKEEEKSSD